MNKSFRSNVMQLVIYHYYSFDTLKRAFVGVHKVIQANDKSECEQVIINGLDIILSLVKLIKYVTILSGFS